MALCISCKWFIALHEQTWWKDEHHLFVEDIQHAASDFTDEERELLTSFGDFNDLARSNSFSIHPLSWVALLWQSFVTCNRLSYLPDKEMWDTPYKNKSTLGTSLHQWSHRICLAPSKHPLEPLVFTLTSLRPGQRLRIWYFGGHTWRTLGSTRFSNCHVGLAQSLQTLSTASWRLTDLLNIWCPPTCHQHGVLLREIVWASVRAGLRIVRGSWVGLQKYVPQLHVLKCYNSNQNKQNTVYSQR